MKDPQAVDRCAKLLRVLAEPERLRLVQALRERPQSVSDLAALLDSEIGNVSHHLKVLRNQGFVTNQRVGKTIIYALSPNVFSRKAAGADRLELGCCRLEIPN